MIIFNPEEIGKSMRFGYSEPLEFIAAMTMIAKVEYMSEIARELRFTPDTEFMEMMDVLISQLSRHVKEEMARFFGKSLTYDRLDNVLHQVFYDVDEPKTVEAWLELYKSRQGEELVAMLAEAVYAGAGSDWLGGNNYEMVRQDPVLLYQLVAAHPIPDAEVHAELMEHIRFHEEFKLRTLLVLDSFQQGFAVIRDRLKELGEEGAVRYAEHFAGHPERAFGDLANSNQGLIVKPTRIHVSYISQVRMDFRHIERESRPDWMILGFRNDALAWQREEKETIEKFLKVIADKRRLDMIELLKERNRYAGELAQLMELTPAAINYHTNLLIDLNLIRITRSDNRIYYELDTDRLSIMMDQTKRLLLR
ncbi:ArsR family transcriptional regulator [Paenibacillus sp. GP183]|uniref:ArsR/SmtB family transcription factor n=1 Tax=Paenibacillus sp. GP183 TaxID=1882751 RepID=UPI000B8475BC|nr:ArsR family transcriptional regulator [Paenibacillus sp. GP183]